MNNLRFFNGFVRFDSHPHRHNRPRSTQAEYHGASCRRGDSSLPKDGSDGTSFLATNKTYLMGLQESPPKKLSCRCGIISMSTKPAISFEHPQSRCVGRPPLIARWYASSPHLLRIREAVKLRFPHHRRPPVDRCPYLTGASSSPTRR
jgi:hypothetical protein